MNVKDKLIKIFNFIIYWSLIILPFSIGIAQGVKETVTGFIIGFFVLGKIIKREKLFIKTVVNLPFLLFILVSIISFKNSIDYKASFMGIVKFIKYGFIFLVYAEEMRDLKHLRRIIVSVICGVCLVSIDGLWQYIFKQDFIRGQPLCTFFILPRTTASFPWPNAMGIYLAALAPFLFGFALFYFRGKKKYLMFAPAIVGVAGLYLTFSRGAGLGFFIAVLFMAIVRKSKFIITVLIAILLVFPFIMPKNIKVWARQVNYNPVVFMCNPERLTIYATAVNMIKHHPVVGVGVNTFSKNYAKYKLVEMEKYAATPDSMYAHNNFLHMAAEVGLIGLGIFLWFLFMLFRQGWQMYGRFDLEFLKITALSLLSCLIAFLINGLTETSLYNGRVVTVFWFITGLLLSLNNFTKIKESSGK